MRHSFGAGQGSMSSFPSLHFPARTKLLISLCESAWDALQNWDQRLEKEAMPLCRPSSMLDLRLVGPFYITCISHAYLYHHFTCFSMFFRMHGSDWFGFANRAYSQNQGLRIESLEHCTELLLAHRARAILDTMHMRRVWNSTMMGTYGNHMGTICNHGSSFWKECQSVLRNKALIKRPPLPPLTLSTNGGHTHRIELRTLQFAWLDGMYARWLKNEVPHWQAVLNGVLQAKFTLPICIMSSSYQKLLSLSKRLNTATTSAAGIAALRDMWQRKLRTHTSHLLCKSPGYEQFARSFVLIKWRTRTLQCRFRVGKFHLFRSSVSFPARLVQERAWLMWEPAESWRKPQNVSRKPSRHYLFPRQFGGWEFVHFVGKCWKNCWHIYVETIRVSLERDLAEGWGLTPSDQWSVPKQQPAAYHNISQTLFRKN